MKENLSKEVTQKLSEQNRNQLTESLEEQKKSVADSAELLRGFMIGVENLGENVKGIRKETDYWRNPEAMEAEEELNRLHDKVPLHIPASKGQKLQRFHFQKIRLLCLLRDRIFFL